MMRESAILTNTVPRHGAINIVVIAILFGAALLPRFPVGALELRLSDIVVLGALPFFLLLIGKVRRSPHFSRYFLFYVAMILSTLHSYVRLGVPRSSGDFNELVRAAIPLLILWWCQFSKSDEVANAIHAFFAVATPLIIMFSVLQAVYPNFFPRWFLLGYGGQAHVNLLIERPSARIIGTGADPNTGAAIQLLILLYQLNTYVQRRHPINLLWSALSLLMIALSGSRTVLLAVIFLALVVTLFSQNVRVLNKVALLLVLAGFLVYVWFTVSYVRLGIQLLISGENQSLLRRLERFAQSIALFLRSPVLGWGPAKSIHPTVVDGEYLLLLRRYGLVGIAAYGWFFVNGILSAARLRSSYKDLLSPREKVLVGTFLLYSLAALVIMLTNNLISGYQLAAPYAVLLGYVDQLERRQRSIQHSPVTRRHAIRHHLLGAV